MPGNAFHGDANLAQGAKLLVLARFRAQPDESCPEETLQFGVGLLCDRFSDSTRVYQGHAGTLNPQIVEALDLIVVGKSRPDLTLMIDVYHELEFPYEVMQSVARALKQGGRLALVEYRAEDPGVPIKRLHKMSEAQIRKEAAPHGLAHERTSDVLPWQHVVIFRKV